jgi:hypothetical protein
MRTFSIVDGFANRSPTVVYCFDALARDIEPMVAIHDWLGRMRRARL